MKIVMAALLFIVVACVSSYFCLKVSKLRWFYLQHLSVGLAFFGMLFALARIYDEDWRQNIAKLDLSARREFSYVQTSAEYAMDDCAVWWNIVLDQTNKNPPVCDKPHPKLQGQTCKPTCRMGHLIIQHLYRPYDPAQAVSNARGLAADICNSGSANQGVCASLNRYAEAVETLELARKNMSFLINSTQSWFYFASQLLFAIALGLQVGKTTSDIRRS